MSARPHNRLLLRITGDGVSPLSVPLSDVGRVAVLFERILLSIADKAGVSFGGESDTAPVALVAIEERSDGLGIAVDPVLDEPVHTLASAIERDDYEALPYSARKDMAELTRHVMVQRGWGLEISGQDGYDLPATEVRKPVEPPKPARVTAPTTIVGKLISVGLTSHVQVGRRHVVIRVDEKRARQLGAWLFEYVAVDGQATWDAITMDLVKFEVQSVRKVPKVDAARSFGILRDAAGDAWDGVDIGEFMQRVRG